MVTVLTTVQELSLSGCTETEHLQVSAHEHSPSELKKGRAGYRWPCWVPRGISTANEAAQPCRLSN
eukprot:6195030-Pleurochrysis_carterae.AAC.3